MAIRIQCEHCGEPYKLRDELAGKRFKCRQCGGSIGVPPMGKPPQSHSRGSTAVRAQSRAVQRFDAQEALLMRVAIGFACFGVLALGLIGLFMFLGQSTRSHSKEHVIATGNGSPPKKGEDNRPKEFIADSEQAKHKRKSLTSPTKTPPKIANDKSAKDPERKVDQPKAKTRKGSNKKLEEPDDGPVPPKLKEPPKSPLNNAKAIDLCLSALLVEAEISDWHWSAGIGNNFEKQVARVFGLIEIYFDRKSGRLRKNRDRPMESIVPLVQELYSKKITPSFGFSFRNSVAKRKQLLSSLGPPEKTRSGHVSVSRPGAVAPTRIAAEFLRFGYLEIAIGSDGTMRDLVCDVSIDCEHFVRDHPIGKTGT